MAILSFGRGSWKLPSDSNVSVLLSRGNYVDPPPAPFVIKGGGLCCTPMHNTDQGWLRMVCSKKLMRRPGAAVFLGKSLPFGLALNWRKEFLRIRCCFRDESAILDSKPLAELRFEVFELYVVLDCLRGVKDGFAPVHTCT